MFFPKNISTSGLNLIKQRCDPTVWNYVLDQQDKGWRIYCVLQGRGRCYYRERVITIPFWTIEANSKKPGYITWYVAHELAHSMDRNNYNHGPAFMAELKRICPPASWHYETNYKKRNAVSAGISQCQALNTGEIPDDF